MTARYGVSPGGGGVSLREECKITYKDWIPVLMFDLLFSRKVSSLFDIRSYEQFVYALITKLGYFTH